MVSKDSLSELRDAYAEKKEEIEKRLSEFEKKRGGSSSDLFSELCFCILTPQSRAKRADRVIKAMMGRDLIYNGAVEDISNVLRGEIRFHNNKARYIVEARDAFSKECVCAGSPYEIREWLVKNIRGLGYKEASHFLRNIGLGTNIAILDRHILKNLKRYGVISEIPKTLTKKKYLQIEEKMKDFSKKIGIPMSALDLLFWSFETGEIFK